MRKFIYIFVIIVAALLIKLTMTDKARKPLKIGDSVPEFSLKDQDGRLFNSTDVVGKQALVIYFYPKDDTPGCTKEACKFRDEFEVFTDLKAMVVGISSDDVASHKKFAEKYHLPFKLLADTDKKVRKLFGVPRSVLGLLPGRVTYIVDKKGLISYIFNSQFGAQKHIDEAIKALKANSLNKGD